MTTRPRGTGSNSRGSAVFRKRLRRVHRSDPSRRAEQFPTDVKQDSAHSSESSPDRVHCFTVFTDALTHDERNSKADFQMSSSTSCQEVREARIDLLQFDLQHRQVMMTSSSCSREREGEFPLKLDHDLGSFDSSGSRRRDELCSALGRLSSSLVGSRQRTRSLQTTSEFVCEDESVSGSSPSTFVQSRVDCCRCSTDTWSLRSS
ncbi:hypothetical protein F2P81_008537 [Scophthalmus maximus]|uniref:Uncharacterized protein n=1 Tax=Scophthalmus maximus TaxID=52904 RepID=A0A6A4TDK3_SCOMX|nr:hypothetical protein F2P81_008537 [Scophthalmus maximus]